MIGATATRGDAYEGPLSSRRVVPTPDVQVAASFSPTWLSSAEFAAGNYQPTWLIKRLLAQGQPAIVGGPKKSLKTSLVIDLAISLGSGTPFLGEFAVQERVRVAVLSGESGEHTLQETAKRICREKGIAFASVDCFWGFRLPSLSNSDHMATLAAHLRLHEIKVLLIDPLYLCLLSSGSGQGLSAANLFDVGPLLLSISQACLSVGCTPILIHHARKNSASGEPLDLEDLAFAGVQEFARQWVLISRREAYVPGTGQHRLWLTAGGSMGHGGTWSVDIEEGVIDDNFEGRKWEVTVKTAQEAIQVEKESRVSKRREKDEDDRQAQDASLLAALDKLDPDAQGIAKKDLIEASGLSDRKGASTITRLLGTHLEQVQVTKKSGNGTTTSCIGYRRKRDG